MRGSSPPTTCTPGPSSTSPAPAGCASSRPRPTAPPTCPTTPPPSSRRSPTSPPPPARSRSTELLPIAAQTPSADAGSADEDTSSIPWFPILAGIAGLALVALLLLTPRLVRGARRRRRLAGDIEDLWLELRDVAQDLGHAWPVGRSPRRAGEWLGRLLAKPVDGAARRPDRPRRGRDQAPEAAQALDRLVGALEHSRYSRDPETFTAERFHADAALVEQALAAGVTPRDVRRAAVVAGLRRGTAYVLAPARAAPASPAPPRRPSTTRPAGRSTSSSADRALRPVSEGDRALRPVRELTGRFVPVRDGDRTLTGHFRAQRSARSGRRPARRKRPVSATGRARRKCPVRRWVRSRARGGDATAPPCAP